MSDFPPHDRDRERPDEKALTQPLPVVRPEPVGPTEFVQPVAPPVARTAKPAKIKAEKPPYVPIFGNIGAYAFTRFVALVIDFVLVPISFACFIFNAADRGTLAFAPRTSGGFDSIALLAFASALVFAMLFEMIFETTVGKALFGLGVRRGTGQHAGPQRIFIRYILLPIDLLAVGEILALVTRRHQRIGDFAACTVVARHRSGGFVTAFALLLFAGLIYAQATAGGGLGSALAVTAEGAYFIPTLVGGALANVGLAPRPPVPVSMPDASATPSASPSSGETSAASAEPAAAATDAATDAPTRATTAAGTPTDLAATPSARQTT